MKMNFLTLLQINDQIASAVSLDETECDDGYTLTVVYSEITDQNQNRCVKDEKEEIKLVEEDEATIYYGNLREKFKIFIVSTQNEVISTITDYDIIEVTNLSLTIQLSSDDYATIIEDERVK